MKRVWQFHKEKFCSLNKLTQHKKCAELLKELFSTTDVEKRAKLFACYEQMITWMSLKDTIHTRFLIQSPSDLIKEHKKSIDCYHWHLDMANASQKEHNTLCLEKDSEHAKKDFLDIHIYLDNLRACHNIGSIIRTTEALRIGSVHLTQPVNRDKIQKSAMGTEEWVEVTTGTSIDDLPRPLIALETGATAEPYQTFSFPEKCTLALGNEVYGLICV